MGDIRETGCKVGNKEVEVSTSEATDVFTAELSKWFMLEAGFGSTINLLQQVKQCQPPFPFAHDTFVLAQRPGQHARFLWPQAGLGLLGWECTHCFAHLVVILLLVNRNQIYSLFLWPWPSGNQSPSPALGGRYWLINQWDCLTFLT